MRFAKLVRILALTIFMSTICGEAKLQADLLELMWMSWRNY